MTNIVGTDGSNTFMSHSYEWDARNRLVKATTSGVGGNSDSESLYDKDGLRYKHVVTRHSAQNSHSGLDPESSNGHSAPDAEQRSEGDVEEVVSRYFYEDGGRLIAEQVGDTLYTYVHLGAHPVVRFNETRAGSESSLSAYHSQNGVLTDGNQLRDHSSEGLDMNDSDPARHNMGEDVIPASEVESPGSSTITTLLYHRDALGTTLATSFYDADLQQWKINPVDTLPYGQEASFHHAGTGQSTFEFTGKKRDKETNMFYFHDRPLLVGVPHFPQPDRAPIDPYQVTINRYLGLNANPVKYVDPDGRDAVLATMTLSLYGLGHTRLYYQDGLGQWYQSDLFMENKGLDMEKTVFSVFDKSKNFDIFGEGDYSIRIVSSEMMNSELSRSSVVSTYFKTSLDQDVAISDYVNVRAKAINSGLESYALFSNNCKTNSIGALNAGGVKVWDSGTPDPNLSMFYQKVRQEYWDQLGFDREFFDSYEW